MDINDDGTNDVNTMYLPVLISNQTGTPSFRLGLSTTKKGIDVFSSSCPNSRCNVPKKYDESASKSC